MTSLKHLKEKLWASPSDTTQSQTLSSTTEKSPTSLPSSLVPLQLKGPEDLSLVQRMMSAGLGSILTAFVLTPFDVIRIRMQQQEIMPDTKPCCSDHYTELNTSKKNTLVKNKIPVTVPSAHNDAHLFWLDKDYCKNVKSCARIDSTFQGFVTIAKSEGLPTLWRGMSLTLLMAVPANVIYFTGYEYIRDNSPISGPINSLVCGSLARLVAATSISPIELIKTRLQSIPSSKSNPKAFENVLRATLDQFKLRGMSSLFTGLQITLWRDVPFSGIYWSMYESTKFRLSQWLEADFVSRGQSRQNDSRVFLTSFLSGSISGSIAAVLTHPFDVGKTRMQISEDNFAGTKKPSMFKYLLDIWRDEGFTRLFGGLGPRVMKVAPSCAIMISSYEITKRFFQSENRNTLGQ